MKEETRRGLGRVIPIRFMGLLFELIMLMRDDE